MGSHGLSDIAGEVLIDRRRRIFWQQGDALLDGSTRRSGRVQHGHGQRTIFDDNLSSCAHVGEQRGEVARRLGCRDVDRGHMHDDAAVPNPFPVNMLGTSNHLRILPHNYLTIIWRLWS